MGRMIQKHKLSEADYRGERFADFEHPLQGNNDLLVLTQPQIILDIHKQFLAAGADILETNTFNANAISMLDYHMVDLVKELNTAAAVLALAAAAEYTALDPSKPRYVAGSIGPTKKTASQKSGNHGGNEQSRTDENPSKFMLPQMLPLVAKHEKTPKTLGFSGFQVGVEGFEPPTRGL